MIKQEAQLPTLEVEHCMFKFLHCRNLKKMSFYPMLTILGLLGIANSVKSGH